MNKRIDILQALKETVAGSGEYQWTGDDGLFAQAAREIETLRSDNAIWRERWKEATKPLNAETVMSGRLNQEEP